MWLYNVHINPYSHRGYVDHDPKRRRKLLLHAQEIRKLIGKTVEQGLTLVPTRMYFKNGKVKVAIALAQGQTGARQARDDQAARDRSRDARGRQGARADERRRSGSIAPRSPARELDYMRQALESGTSSGDGAFTKRCHALLERDDRRAQGVADDLVHARARDGDAAAGCRGRRRGDLSVVHLRVDRQRVCAARRAPGVRGRPRRHAQSRRARCSKRPSRRAPGRSSSSTTPAWRARWTRSSTSRRVTASLVVEDNAHGLFGHYKGRPLGRLARCRRSAFTRPRT